MSEAPVNQWSDILDEIRQKRRSNIDEELRQKGAAYTTAAFFDSLGKSLETLLTRWFEMKKGAWSDQLPEDPDPVQGELKDELESIVEMELEAMERDIHHAKNQISWASDPLEEGRKKLNDLSEELKISFRLKVDGLSKPDPAQKKEVEKETPKEKKKVKKIRVSGGSSSSGLGVFTMFLVGLLLGGAASFHYWNQSQKEIKKMEAQVEETQSDMRTIDDRLAALQDMFAKLAWGKMRNIPQIQNKIGPIKKKYAAERKKVQSSYRRQKLNVKKKISPGNKLDLSLKRLDDDKEAKLQKIAAREKAALKPLLEELKTLKEMMGK